MDTRERYPDIELFRAVESAIQELQDLGLRIINWVRCWPAGSYHSEICEVALFIPLDADPADYPEQIEDLKVRLIHFPDPDRQR